jgi:hypothetical protein
MYRDVTAVPYERLAMQYELYSMEISPLCKLLLIIASLYYFASVFMIFLCAGDVPSPFK